VVRLHLDAARSPEAITAFQEALHEFEQLLQANSRHTQDRDNLAWACHNIAVSLDVGGRPDEAIAYHDRALQLREELAHDLPGNVNASVSLASSYTIKGQRLRTRGQPAAALEWLGKAIETLEKALQKERGQAEASRFLSNAYADRATVSSEDLGRQPEALADWDRAMKLAVGSRRIEIIIRRAETLARGGDHVRAAAQVNDLETTLAAVPAPVAADAYFLLGFAYALSARAASRDTQLGQDERNQLMKTYGDRAVESFRKSHAAVPLLAVYRTHLREHPELAVLRARPDFTRFLEEVTKGASASQK
jgi:tetratricopeptide (TPR) repeat protein